MAVVTAAVAFKKRDGTLTFSKGRDVLSWAPTAPPGAPPEVTIPVAKITNLQQTPPEKPKVMLKVFAQSAGAVEPIAYLFAFSSPSKARAEAESIRDALGPAIQASKTGEEVVPAAGRNTTSGGSSVAKLLDAQRQRQVESWYDDDKLRSNAELQQSLLKSDPQLSRTFMESSHNRPESISLSQFAAQFWSSRLGLLRAHAIDRSQSKGAYNVLSTLKSRTEDNVSKLNISREQINLIFSQHPLVKRVYDENVPKLSEEAFWSRFFQSRLLKKLKGERITDADHQDSILDKYLSMKDDEDLQARLDAAQVPHIIDLEGNEQNHSQRKGNAPDILMRPSHTDRVPIIRTLNSLSEKLMAPVASADFDPSKPIGMDEATFNELALHDLQGDAAENRIILDVKDQQRFFAASKSSETASDAGTYAHQDPSQVLKTLRTELAATSHVDLGTGIHFDEESDSGSEDEQDGRDQSPSAHVGSKASLRAASAQILAVVTDQWAQQDDLTTAQTVSVETTAAAHDLPVKIYDRVLLTHATTTEFLNHFWSAFLSGDAHRADEIRRLVETLDRAMDRISAVANDAEEERLERIEVRKRQLREHYERTHKKLAFDPKSIKGGAQVVRQLMEPTVAAIREASSRYAEALAQQSTVAAKA